MFFAVCKIIFVYDKLMGITTDIMNLDVIKGVRTLIPVTVESENLIVKGRVISICVTDFVLFNVSVHLAADITEFVHDGSTGAHCGNVQRALFSIIGRLEERQIVPYLLYNIRAGAEGRPVLSINDDIADIIAEGLVEGRGFSIEYTDFHWGIPLSYNVQWVWLPFPTDK
jgi:hypothetical protein